MVTKAQKFYIAAVKEFKNRLKNKADEIRESNIKASELIDLFDHLVVKSCYKQDQKIPDVVSINGVEDQIDVYPLFHQDTFLDTLKLDGYRSNPELCTSSDEGFNTIWFASTIAFVWACRAIVVGSDSVTINSIPLVLEALKEAKKYDTGGYLVDDLEGWSNFLHRLGYGDENVRGSYATTLMSNVLKTEIYDRDGEKAVLYITNMDRVYGPLMEEHTNLYMALVDVKYANRCKPVQPEPVKVQQQVIEVPKATANDEEFLKKAEEMKEEFDKLCDESQSIMDAVVDTLNEAKEKINSEEVHESKANEKTVHNAFLQLEKELDKIEKDFKRDMKEAISEHKSRYSSGGGGGGSGNSGLSGWEVAGMILGGAVLGVGAFAAYKHFSGGSAGDSFASIAEGLTSLDSLDI